MGTYHKQSISKSLSIGPSKEINWSVPCYGHPKLFSAGKKSQLSWGHIGICTIGPTQNMTSGINALCWTPLW